MIDDLFDLSDLKIQDGHLKSIGLCLAPRSDVDMPNSFEENVRKCPFESKFSWNPKLLPENQ